MKKIIIAVFLFGGLTVCRNAAFSQTVVGKFKPIGLSYTSIADNPYTKKKIDPINSVGYVMGFGAEVPFKDRWGFQGSFDIIIGKAVAFYLKSDIKYYVSGEALDGAYVGMATGFAFGENGVISIPIAGQVGYQHMVLDDKLTIEGDIEIGGVFAVTEDYPGAFYVGFGFTVGYVFQK